MKTKCGYVICGDNFPHGQEFHHVDDSSKVLCVSEDATVKYFMIESCKCVV